MSFETQWIANEAAKIREAWTPEQEQRRRVDVTIVRHGYEGRRVHETRKAPAIADRDE